MHSDKGSAQLVVQVLADRGIEHVVISPGSRNAPLIIEFFNAAQFQLYSIVDERSAAFFALGLAQQLRHPVALCCTSGSAILNYYPAVAEAFYQQCPLLVLSADRPEAFIDQGMGQTIRQRNVLANHVLESVALTDSGPQSVVTLSRAVDRAVMHRRPIHVNLHFDEPLYGQTSQRCTFDLPAPEVQPAEVNGNALDDFIEKWQASSKKMVILGTLPPSASSNCLLARLADDPSVAVLSETTSNMHAEAFFSLIDQLIMPLSTADFQAYAPEVLLGLGTNIISKKIKALLREQQPNYIGQVGTQSPLPATFGKITHPFAMDPEVFLSRFVHRLAAKKSPYRSAWKRLKKYRSARHQAYLEAAPYSDLKVVETLLNRVPDGYQLQLGNSSVVRYAQLFQPSYSGRVAANRGISGIDGSSSTALGAAWLAGSPTVFISGDLSFFYDSNALWIKYVRADFRVVLLNNGGGGIFKFISDLGASSKAEDFFTTPHALHAGHLAAMHHWAYDCVSNLAALHRALTVFFEASERPKLLEICTREVDNTAVLRAYFDRLK